MSLKMSNNVIYKCVVRTCMVFFLSAFILCFGAATETLAKVPYQKIPFTILKEMTVTEFLSLLKEEPHDPIILGGDGQTSIEWPNKEELALLISSIGDKSPCSHVLSDLDSTIFREMTPSTVGDQAFFIILSMYQGSYPAYSSDTTLIHFSPASHERQKIIDWAKREVWWQKFWKFFVLR